MFCRADGKRFGLLLIFPYVILIVGTFALYVIPISDWRHRCDDYGLVYARQQMDPSKGISQFFSSKPNLFLQWPSNIVKEMQPSFFSVAYRPLVPILLMSQEWFSGKVNHYRVYLVTIFLFAVSVAFLFYILSLAAPFYVAFAGAVFFATHSNLAGWLGDTCRQPYIIVLISLLLMGLFLKKAIETAHLGYGFAAYSAFTVSLLFHEWPLVMPFWLLCAIPAYAVSIGKKPFQRVNLILMLSPVVILLLYFAVRVFTYPVDLNASHMIFDPRSVVSNFVTKLIYLDFIPIVVDILGLGWLGSGSAVGKLICLGAAFIGWMYLFWKSPYKLGMAVFACGAALFCWPSLLLYFTPGFGFLSVPFLILSVLVGVYGRPVASRVAACVFLFLGMMGAWHNIRAMRVKSRDLVGADEAVKVFARSRENPHSAMLTVGVPDNWVPTWGTTQAVWLYGDDASFPVYTDVVLNTMSPVSMQDGVGKSLPVKNLVDIQVVGKTIRMKTMDRNKLWFSGGAPNAEEAKCGIGRWKVYQQEMVGYQMRAYDVEVCVDDKWLADGLNLVSWDFECKKMRVIGKIGVPDGFN